MPELILLAQPFSTLSMVGVAPLMLLEAGTAAILVVWRPAGVSVWLARIIHGVGRIVNPSVNS